MTPWNGDFLRAFGLFLVATSVVVRGADRAPEVRAEGPVVELPKFEVTASRELPTPESWRYASIPGFEILSNASDRATRRMLDDLGWLRMALSYVWPLPELPGPPTVLIVSAKGAKFDAFVTPLTAAAKKAGGIDTPRVSLFLKDGERTAILLDVESDAVAIPTLHYQGMGADTGMFTVEPRKQLTHQYVQFLLARANPRLPAWFEEGMAQLVMAMRVDPKYIEFGRLEDPNILPLGPAVPSVVNDEDYVPPAEERDFNAIFVGAPLMPMRDFFAVTHDAPDAMNPLGNNLWAKQAYAFVHMCLYSGNGKWLKPLSELLNRSTRGEVTEADFTECFKMNYKEMLAELRRYVDYPVFKAALYLPKGGKGAKFPEPEKIVLREATQAEVGRIKGETLLLAGRKEAAELELIAPYVRGERDPALLAALGLHERTKGETERARKFLEAAVAGRTARTDAYLELARLRFAEAEAKPGAAEGKFSEEQVAGITGPLMGARAQPVAVSAVYELLAETWGRSAVIAKREEVAVLLEGAELFPGRLRLAYLTALVCDRAGFAEQAHLLADHGIRHVGDEKGRQRFVEMKATLRPVSVPGAGQSQSQPAGMGR